MKPITERHSEHRPPMTEPYLSPPGGLPRDGIPGSARQPAGASAPREEGGGRPYSSNVWGAVVIVGVVTALTAMTLVGAPGRWGGMGLPADPQARAHLDATGTAHQTIQLEETLVLGAIHGHSVLAPGETDTSEAGAAR